MASTVLAAEAIAAATSPSLRTVRSLGLANSSAARCANQAELCCAVGPSSHVTCSCWRATLALYQLSATIATPGMSPSSAVPTPFTTKACVTPGSLRTWSKLALATLPPNTGHFSNTAHFIPGTITSMPKSGLPVMIALLSTPWMRLPSSVKFFGSLSGTVFKSGAGIVDAVAASLPYGSERLLAACVTTPLAVVSSPTGTFHVFAAAARSMARAAAPTCRWVSKFIGVDCEPPANWMPYFASSLSACSTVTWLHSTSSSSAMIIGSDCFTPWPSSGFLAMMTIRPSA